VFQAPAKRRPGSSMPTCSPFQAAVTNGPTGNERG